MRWSPGTRHAPLSRSVATPCATSLLASITQRPLTMPPHWSAYAAMLPTSPPPPMMLTFMGVLALQCCNDLFRDQLHKLLQIWSLRTAIATKRRFLNVTAPKRIVRAQVAVFALVKPLV